jgi:hypothetical protein
VLLLEPHVLQLEEILLLLELKHAMTEIQLVTMDAALLEQ